MRPYIIKRFDQFLSDFILPSVFFVIIAPLLILCNEKSLFVCLSLPYFCYLAYIIYKMTIFKKKKQNFESLVINKHGIKCEDKKETFNAIWDDISQICLSRNGPNRGRWTEMTIICNDGDKYTFSFKPYTYAMNLYRLRKHIINFSKRKDIITANFYLWTQW